MIQISTRRRAFCSEFLTLRHQSFEWLPSHIGAASECLQPQKNARPSFSAVNFTGERPVSLWLPSQKGWLALLPQAHQK